jgi:hypothetical protein
MPEGEPRQSVDQRMSLEERRHRDESFNDAFGAWLGGRIVPKRSLDKVGLQAA